MYIDLYLYCILYIYVYMYRFVALLLIVSHIKMFPLLDIYNIYTQVATIIHISTFMYIYLYIDI